MLPIQILDRFVERCPAVVMVRAVLERLLRPERLDQIFEASARRQYIKQLLFSQLVALMAAVATRTHASVHSAYLAMKDRLGVSPAALYGKLNLAELGISQALVRETAADAAEVIDALPAAGKEVLPGLEVFYLDGKSPGVHRTPGRGTPHDPRGAVAGAIAGALGRAAGVDRRLDPV